VQYNSRNRRLQTGFPVHFAVRPAHRKPIVGSGLVVRTLGENRMGIQLNQLSMVESERLQEFPLPLMMRESVEAHAVRT
jgi:hypothetical protein